jgi:Putative Ig domain
MSPIALADARTTNRGCCFCLAVVFCLFVPVFSAAQHYRYAEDFRDTPISRVVHSVIVFANFPPAVQGQAYASTLRVAEGLPPYRFWIAQGALPSGLSLNTSTGVISGVPAVSGTFAFMVGVIDAQHGFGRRMLQLNVGASAQTQISIALSPQSVQLAPGAKVQFTATVRNTAQTAVVWAASEGSISPDGLFTAPTSTGTAVVTATAAASSGAHTSASISVQSLPPLTIATSALTNAQVNAPYSATITAQGGTAPYTWSLSSGSLPSGLTLDAATGVIAGSVSQAGAFAFTTEVTDASAHSATRQLTLDATAVSSGNFDGPAELPRTTVQSALAQTPAPGNTIVVNAGTDLQTALSRANCGDTIQLEAGATFNGNFTLPAKNCDDSNWIIIRTSAPDASLPPEGTRISPCYAGVASLPGRPALNCASTQKVMATLMAIKAGGPFTLASNASHYRLGPGLEITRPAGTGINFGLIIKDGSIPADHIIVDRDWVHGTAQDDTTRGLYLSGVTYAAVVDSYFNDFHCVTGIGTCVDSQTIGGGLGNLPQGIWKIENNFLEAAAENILFGGGGGTTIPTDIEIRHNHLFKPLTWMAGQPGFVGGVNTDPTKCVKFNTPGYCPFVVKNLLELKNAQRVLFEGNVLEHTWPGFTQHGVAIVLTALSQGAAGNPNATVADITIRYNHISHAASGIVMGEANYGQGPPKLEARISIHDDLFDDLSPAYYNGDTSVVAGMAFQLSFCSTCTPIRDVLINRVTMLLTSPRMFMVLGAPLGARIENLTFTNNIVSSPQGLTITGTGAGAPCAFSGATNLARLNSCVGPYSFTANALIGATTTWPAGNTYPYAVSDVALNSANLGADVNAVSQATSGAQ